MAQPAAPSVGRAAATWMRPATVVIAILASIACAPAHAQTFDVPDGFVVDGSPPERAGALVPIVEVQPEQGPFSSLSRLTLYRVPAPVRDPEAWLEEQVSISVVEPDVDAGSWFDSPDSPFGDTAFSFLGSFVPGLVERMRSLGQLPLEACDDAYIGSNEAGEFHRLDCRWSIGPLHQYRQLRLQQVDGTWYLTRMETMNERRLRHFEAIANTFHR